MFRSILAILIVLLIIVVAAVVPAQTNFTVQPMSVVQAEGLEAVFECLYPGAISYAWAINGIFLSNYTTDIVAVSPSGDSPASLTISARPEYNNTVIQCGATVPGPMGGFLLSVNAALTVYRSNIDQTTFTVHPVSVTQVEGMNVVFECLYPNATSFSWAVNGTSQSVFPTGIVVVSPSGDSPASLTIPAIPKYNNTVVHCEAVGEGVGNILSESATLKVQGLVESVSNLRFMNEASCVSISIAWVAPFSLNLTNSEPDVLYYVDVYNITGGEEVMVESVNIADQYYNFSHANLSLSQEFKFKVTPVSNVLGAVNGTNSQHLQLRLGAPIPISSDHVRIRNDINPNLNLDPIRVIFPVDAVATCKEHMPDKYSVQVKFTDTNGNDSVNCLTVFELKNNTVELTVIKDSNCNINRHQLCNITVIAENEIGNSSSYPEMEASTHDVQNVTADSSNPGQLDIRCSYLNGSTDEGFFTIVYSSSKRSDITYRVAARNGLEPTTNLSIVNLQHDEYQFVVYDLPVSMIPEEKPATEWMQTFVEIAEDSQQNNSDTMVPDTLLPWSPEVTSPGDGMVCISCSFSDPRTTGCVGVIHSADLVNLALTILPVSRPDNNQPHNSNCTPDVLIQGDYFVAVFGQLVDRLETAPAVVTLITVMSTPTTQDPSVTTTFNSNSGSDEQILGAAVGGTFAALALSLIILLIGIVVMVLVCRRKSKTVPSVESAQMTPSSRYENSPLLTKSGPHYETVELPDRPPDYETVVPNGNRQETRIPIDDGAPPLPPSCKPEDIIIGCSQGQLIQHGTVSVSSMTAVEELQSQPESHDTHMEVYVAPEPAYDVTKRVLVKESTNTGPLLDSTTTEHQYSEIGGSINKEGIHYVHVNPKPKPEGLPDQPVDPTAVVYSEVKKEKLVPKSEESEQPPQIKTAPPTSPSPPTAESLLSIIHPLAVKWEEFGKALEIDDDRMDDFSNEAHDQVRLHDMVHYYFSNVHVKHTWEEFVQALRKIEEYECADKIVREKKLQGVETPSAVVVPPIPPRKNKQANGGANEAKNDSEQMSQSTSEGRDTIDEEVSTKRFGPPLEESQTNNNSCSSVLLSKEESSAGVAQESVNEASNLAAGGDPDRGVSQRTDTVITPGHGADQYPSFSHFLECKLDHHDLSLIAFDRTPTRSCVSSREIRVEEEDSFPVQETQESAESCFVSSNFTRSSLIQEEFFQQVYVPKFTQKLTEPVRHTVSFLNEDNLSCEENNNEECNSSHDSDINHNLVNNGVRKYESDPFADPEDSKTTKHSGAIDLLSSLNVSREVLRKMVPRSKPSLCDLFLSVLKKDSVKTKPVTYLGEEDSEKSSVTHAVSDETSAPEMVKTVADVLESFDSGHVLCTGVKKVVHTKDEGSRSPFVFVNLLCSSVTHAVSDETSAPEMVKTVADVLESFDSGHDLCTEVKEVVHNKDEGPRSPFVNQLCLSKFVRRPMGILSWGPIVKVDDPLGSAFFSHLQVNYAPVEDTGGADAPVKEAVDIAPDKRQARFNPEWLTYVSAPWSGLFASKGLQLPEHGQLFQPESEQDALLKPCPVVKLGNFDEHWHKMKGFQFVNHSCLEPFQPAVNWLL